MKKDAVLTTLFIIGVILLVFGFIFGLAKLADYSSQMRCRNLGKTISYQTEYRAGYCFVELKPDIWVKESEVLFVLPLLFNGDEK